MLASLRVLTPLAVALAVTGCAVNPVTGKPEITLVSEAGEIQMGQQNYAPMQQAQGGEFDVDPELTSYVQGVGDRLAAVADRQLPYEFVVLNNSVPNAWALPGGKIAINRGLLTELESEAELAAVLGHEIVHAAARHSARQMERGMFLQGLVVATAVVTNDGEYGKYLLGSAAVGAQLLTQAYGRDAERESDLYGMRYMSRAGYDPQGAVTLQEKFVRLSQGQESDWLSGLFASHPPSQERVTANRKTAATLPAGGRMGGTEYQRAMARTRAAMPAYEAYDEGREALAAKDTTKAAAQAEKAIGLFPAEANFYALRGDARLLDKDYDGAVTNYDNAVNRRDDFFYYYLQRGLAQEKAGSDEAAKSDLERSLTLLPTAPAHYTLGNLARKRGDKAVAIEHYRAVAGGKGEMATEARASLARLDLPDNPGSYLLTGCDADASGNLVVLVKNDTPVAVTDVVVSVSYRDNAGTSRQQQRSFSGLFQPGQVRGIETGLGPYSRGADCPATIVSARAAD